MLPEPPRRIEIRLPSSHPQLLEGLDALLRLGLISNAQVRLLCEEYLSCTVVLQPQPEMAVAISDPVEHLPVAALASSTASKVPQKPAEPSLIATMLQSLGAELSVRWLLFLGLFLVVVSSGVLAASQWERFPSSGQYAVLLAYTLSFWGFSFWASKQNNLTLTAQTLLIVTLLLVPVNFWAMDSFKLWQNPLDWLTVAIATPILTVITVLIYKNRLFVTNFRRQKLLLVNILGLSYLHWGWQLPSFPLIAVYVAMVGTTIVTLYHNRHLQINSPIPPENTDERRINVGINLPAAVIVYALLVLLVRAIFVAQIDVTQLGLAVGLCGWLMTWLAQKHLTPQVATQDSHPFLSTSVIWERFGGVLLVLGWLVSVFNYPGQAIAVSGLGLFYVGDRLRRYSLNVDLAVIFLVGLQTMWLAWRLIPSGLQKSAIAIATQLTQSQNEPWTLLSVAVFPYIIFMVVLTQGLYRLQKRDLAKFGEILTLGLGAMLTTISLENPVLRSLNLLLSTITLAYVVQQRAYQPPEVDIEPPPSPFSAATSSPPLVYLTHVTGLLTLCCTIAWFFPNLNNTVWAGILLVLLVGEWAFSLRSSIWRDSAWYIGFPLAAISFLLLWANAELTWYGNVSLQDHWGIIWLITPIALTGIASRTTTPRRNLSSFLSVLAVGVAQLLTLHLPGTRLLGLAVAVGLMLVNTRYLRHLAAAIITESFVLALIIALLWEGIPGLPRLSVAGWLIAGAIATLSFWLGRTALGRRGGELSQIYAEASDKWAIALSVFELSMLTLHSFAVYNAITPPGFLYLIATGITLSAIAYRSWGQPTNWAFYGIGWGVELLLAELLGFWGRSTINIAIANIALGLFTQLLGEWWRRKYQLTRLQSSLHILPLIYAALSVLLRANTFADWTGFLSLGVALTVIGVGRRREEFRPLLYLGIIGVSISAYELLFYQMSQAAGGAYGDGLIAMSALGVGIMYAYRILSPWLIDYLRLTKEQLKTIAHIHWAWSSLLLLAAITVPIAVNRLVGLGTGVFLIQYAIFEGRRPRTTEEETSPLIFGRITIAETWVYLGLLLIAAMRVYWRETAVGQLLFGPLMPWNGAIACVVAYFLYILPWENWGWPKKPWQHAAYIVPLVILWETRLQVYPITLLIAAGFYIFLAKVAANIRFTYLSVALVDWALFRWFDSLQLTDALWYLTPLSLSLLYIAQVDPQLQLSAYKPIRHSLRLVGSGIICGWAILFHQDTPLIPGILSLIAIFAGLALRVRAFLYIGTATFFITSIYQLVIFSLRYPFLKWIIGLLVGIVLISIAANFETRRAQITSLLRNTNNEFQEWE
jgi:hypothetical protein